MINFGNYVGINIDMPSRYMPTKTIEEIYNSYVGLPHNIENINCLSREVDDYCARQGFDMRFIRGRCHETRLDSWWYIQNETLNYTIGSEFSLSLHGWYSDYLDMPMTNMISYNENGLVLVLTSGEGIFMFREDKRIQPPYEHLYPNRISIK